MRYVVGFVHPFDVFVWLVTATDSERDTLSSNPFFAETAATITAGQFPSEHGTIKGTVAQSQETVGAIRNAMALDRRMFLDRTRLVKNRPSPRPLARAVY